MNPNKVATEAELWKHLTTRGFVKTDERTETGVFWKHEKSGKHMIVPNSEQGFYPTWLTEDMWGVARRIEIENDN